MKNSILDAAKQSGLNRVICPENVLAIEYHESNNIFILSSLNGEILTHKEIGELIKELKKAYKIITAEEIEVRNSQANQSKTPPQVKRKSQTIKSGFVYLITDNCGSHKVGMSKNPMQRLESLRRSTANNLELVHTINTIDMIGLEAYFHGVFLAYKISGEWFKLPDSAIAEFVGYEDIAS